MTVQVLFFGATAEITGKSKVELELPTGAISRNIFEKLTADFPSLLRHRLLYSVNQQYASGNEILADDDEIAVFTAVSGG